MSRLHFVFLLCLFTLCHGDFIAQTEPDRELQIGPFLGRASMRVEVGQADSLRNGPFQFRATQNTDSLLLGCQLDGFYLQGALDGPWKVRISSFEAGNKPQVADYRIELPANGKSKFLQADFKNNKAHGPWRFVEEGVVEGARGDSLHSIQLSFENGQAAKSFSAWWPDTQISGAFDEEHRLHGTWRFAYTQNGESYLEQRNYDQGMLLAVSIEAGGEKWELEIQEALGAELSEEVLDQTVIEERTLDADGLALPMLAAASNGNYGSAYGPWLEVAERLHQDLDEAFETLVQPDDWDLWGALTSGCMIQRPIVRMRVFPFSESERSRLQKARQQLDEVFAESQRIFNDPLLEVTTLANEVQAADAALLELLTVKLRQADGFIRYYEHPGMQWIDRERVLADRLPEIDFPKELRYRFQQESRTKEIDLEGLPREDLASFFQGLDKTCERFFTTAKRIAENIADYRKESQLAEREEELIALKDSIEGLFSGSLKEKLYNSWHKRYQRMVTQAANEQLEAFLLLPLDERKIAIEETEQCLQALRDFHFVCSQVPQRVKNLDEAYSRTVWNPYTYTDMTERVKERVYRAYEQVLLPAVAAQFDEEINCATLAEDMLDFQLLYRRMLDLREVDTKELEKQLRRKTEVDELLELFDLKLTIR